MSDLISREALLAEYAKKCGGECRSCDLETHTGECHLILDAPVINAVEIVRCRDCKHRGLPLNCPMCHDEVYYDGDGYSDWFPVDNTIDDGFCYAGERNEEI